MRILSESDLTQHEDNILKIMNNVTTGLSILGIAYFFYLKFKVKNVSFILKLITNLIISDLLYSISNVLINFDSNHTVCTIEGFVREFSQLTTLFWAVSLGYSAYCQTVRGISNLHTKYWVMKLIGLTIPFLISIVPFFPYSTLQYGKMGAYCWIVSQENGTEIPFWVSILLLLGYIWGAIILLVYWYGRIYLFMRNVKQKAISIKRLFIYPMILLISFFPTTLDKFLSDTSWVFVSAMIHIATQHSNGFLNAITYGIQTTKAHQTNHKVYEETSDSSLKESLKNKNANVNVLIEKSAENHENFNDEINESMSNSIRHELLQASDSSVE